MVVGVIAGLWPQPCRLDAAEPACACPIELAPKAGQQRAQLGCGDGMGAMPGQAWQGATPTSPPRPIDGGMRPSWLLLSQVGIDLNAADDAALRELPGVGPHLAKAILAYRREHGPFATVAQLGQVPGIGAKTLARLRPSVRATVRP